MTVYPFDHAYLRVPCPRCAFKVHVRFRLAQLGVRPSARVAKPGFTLWMTKLADIEHGVASITLLPNSTMNSRNSTPLYKSLSRSKSTALAEVLVALNVCAKYSVAVVAAGIGCPRRHSRPRQQTPDTLNGSRSHRPREVGTPVASAPNCLVHRKREPHVFARGLRCRHRPPPVPRSGKSVVRIPIGLPALTRGSVSRPGRLTLEDHPMPLDKTGTPGGAC